MKINNDKRGFVFIVKFLFDAQKSFTEDFFSVSFWVIYCIGHGATRDGLVLNLFSYPGLKWFDEQ